MGRRKNAKFRKNNSFGIWFGIAEWSYVAESNKKQNNLGFVAYLTHKNNRIQKAVKLY